MRDLLGTSGEIPAKARCTRFWTLSTTLRLQHENKRDRVWLFCIWVFLTIGVTAGSWLGPVEAESPTHCSSESRWRRSVGSPHCALAGRRELGSTPVDRRSSASLGAAGDRSGGSRSPNVLRRREPIRVGRARSQCRTDVSPYAARSRRSGRVARRTRGDLVGRASTRVSTTRRSRRPTHRSRRLAFGGVVRSAGCRAGTRCRGRRAPSSLALTIPMQGYAFERHLPDPARCLLTSSSRSCSSSCCAAADCPSGLALCLWGWSSAGARSSSPARPTSTSLGIALLLARVPRAASRRVPWKHEGRKLAAGVAARTGRRRPREVPAARSLFPFAYRRHARRRVALVARSLRRPSSSRDLTRALRPRWKAASRESDRGVGASTRCVGRSFRESCYPWIAAACERLLPAGELWRLRRTHGALAQEARSGH